MRFISAGITDIGISKHTNQDSMLIKVAQTKNQNQIAIGIICDGMGGLEKAVVYYQIKSDISIPPLMLNLQINKGESAYNLNTLCDYEYKNIAGY